MKVKLRLRKRLYLNGRRRDPGNVVILEPAIAEWLIKRRVAVELGRR